MAKNSSRCSQAQDKDDMENLKKSINQSSAIQNKSNRTISKRDYSIATDSDCIKVNNNDMTRTQYQFIRDKTISAYVKFRQTRHAAVLNIKVSKDRRKLRSLDLSDKKWLDVTEIRSESLNVITSEGLCVQEKDKVGYDLW